MERLYKIKEVLQEHWEEWEEKCHIMDDECRIFELCCLCTFSIDDVDDGDANHSHEEVGLRFYRRAYPSTAAILVKVLCDHDIDFVIWDEEEHLVFDDDGECVDVLFDEEADLEYKKEIYREMQEYYREEAELIKTHFLPN